MTTTQVKTMTVFVAGINIIASTMLLLSLIQWDGDLSYLVEVFSGQGARMGCAAVSILTLIISLVMFNGRNSNTIDVYEHSIDY